MASEAVEKAMKTINKRFYLIKSDQANILTILETLESEVEQRVRDEPPQASQHRF